MDRMEDLKGAVEKDLETELRDLIPLLAAARGIVSTGSSNSTVVVQAGGVAVWLAVVACAVVVGMTMTAMIFVAIGMSDLNRQTQEIRQTNETQQAYINAAFSQPEKEK